MPSSLEERFPNEGFSPTCFDGEKHDIELMVTTPTHHYYQCTQCAESTKIWSPWRKEHWDEWEQGVSE